MSYFNLYRTKASMEATFPKVRLRFDTDEEYTEYLLSQPYSERLSEREYTLVNELNSNPIKLPQEVDDFVYALKSGKVNKSLGYDFYNNIRLNKYLESIMLPAVAGYTYNKLHNHYMLPLFKTYVTIVTTEDLYDSEGNVIETREVKTDYHYVEIIYLEPDSPFYGKCCTIPINEYDKLSEIYLKDNWWIFKWLQSKFDHDLFYFFSPKGLGFINNKLNIMTDKIIKSNLLSIKK